MKSGSTLSAIVLCGGRSNRMGEDKAGVKLGEKSLLRLTIESIDPVASPIVVVGAPSQSLPALPSQVVVIRDALPYPGPLAAMLRGFQHLQSITEVSDLDSSVWVSGCDTPFVTAEIIHELHQRLVSSAVDAVTLTESSRKNPLLAIYRRHNIDVLKEAVENGTRRATDFLNSLNVIEQPWQELTSAEACIKPTANLNTPEDLASVRRSI